MSKFDGYMCDQCGLKHAQEGGSGERDNILLPWKEITVYGFNGSTFTARMGTYHFCSGACAAKGMTRLLIPATPPSNSPVVKDHVGGYR